MSLIERGADDNVAPAAAAAIIFCIIIRRKTLCLNLTPNRRLCRACLSGPNGYYYCMMFYNAIDIIGRISFLFLMVTRISD